MSTLNIGFYDSKAMLMTTHKIGFYEDLTKIIFQLSSNIITLSLLLTSKKLHHQEPSKAIVFLFYVLPIFSATS